MFEAFRVTVEGDRIIVDPLLRPEWQPEGDWHALDFGDPDGEGVEVVDFVGPVLKRVDLWGEGSEPYL